MSIVALPAGFRIETIDWHPIIDATANRSAWTKKRTAIVNPFAAMWTAKVQLAPASEAAGPALIAFFAALDGPANSFRIPATRAAQAGFSHAGRVFGDGQTSPTALFCADLPINTIIAAGTRFTIDDELFVLTQDCVTTGDAGTLVFKPARRDYSWATDEPVELQNPKCLVSLKDGEQVSWTVSPSGIHYFAPFEVEEAF
jgi:hypothetical protein